MFLHSGASLHGHEYSPPNQPAAKPYLRAAYARPRPYSDIFMARTPITPVTEDDPSVYDSDNSLPSSQIRKPRAPRKSTTYVFAIPAPESRVKRHLPKSIRPRLLLQLQELPTGKRTRPVIDVYSSALVAGPRVTARYMRRFAHILGVKGELGPRDRILVKSEDYDTTLTDSDSDDDCSSGRRELVAVFRMVRGQECEEIIFDDESIWTATPNAKGGFDFVNVDVHGITTTARWVRKSTLKTGAISPTNSTSAVPSFPPSRATSSSNYKFTFSVMDPLSRRHPILATLTSTSLEVNEDYTTPSSTSQRRFPPIRPLSFAGSVPTFDEPSAERQTHTVDQNTKKLITVTALWLSMRQAPEPTLEEAPTPQETTIPSPSRPPPSTPLPRRQTTSAPTRHAPAPSIRRALSTGAAFMQRRTQKHSRPVHHGCDETELTDVQGTAAANEGTENSNGSVQRQSRRVSWLRMFGR